MIEVEYARAVSEAAERSSSVSPIALGLTASIDELYSMDETRVDALSTAARSTGPGEGPGIARHILNLIRNGRGGEIVASWADGHAWLESILGVADTRQVGGNAAQAAWALASIGAPALLALRDRSASQVSVLDPRILVAEGGHTIAVRELAASGSPTKQPHGILEFAAGVPLNGYPLPRTTRVMLRFSHEPLETDAEFAGYTEENPPGVALLSGLATQPNILTADARWAVRLGARLQRSGTHVHHELSDFGHPARLRTAIRELPATSIGMSLSELVAATGHGADPAESAIALARGVGVSRAVVHADEWSMIVTRTPSDGQRRSLLLANALAGVRARLGRPGDRSEVIGLNESDTGVSFTQDHPPSGPRSEGWHALVAPSPYMSRPVATVGLGDTFTAGLLLGEALWN